MMTVYKSLLFACSQYKDIATVLNEGRVAKYLSYQLQKVASAAS